MDCVYKICYYLVLLSLFRNVHCILSLTSQKTYTFADIFESIQKFQNSGNSLHLIKFVNKYVYIGSKNQVFEIDQGNLNSYFAPLQWSQDNSLYQKCLVTNAADPSICVNNVNSLYFSSNSTTVVACGSNFGKATCRTFKTNCNVCVWSDTGINLKQDISNLIYFENDKSDYLSIPVDNSHFLFKKFTLGGGPSMTLTQIYQDDFPKLGLVSVDPFNGIVARDNWIKQNANPIFTRKYNEKLYLLYSEEGYEVDNYMQNVDYASKLVQHPTFTRLARVCLNDPGLPTETLTGISSFFKIRLACRHSSGVIFDKVDFASEIGPDSRFYAVMRSSNSIEGESPSALCQFSIDAAEQAINSGDFLEHQPSTSGSSASVRRVTRSELSSRSFRGENLTSCDWSQDNVNYLRRYGLGPERLAPLIAQPLVSQALVSFSALSKHKVTAVGAMFNVPDSSNSSTDIVFLGTDTGSLFKIVSSTATLVESLISINGGKKISRISFAKSGFEDRVLTFSDTVVLSLPVARCNKQLTCQECVALKDPHCSWNIAAVKCEQNNKGLFNLIKGEHADCPASTTTTHIKTAALTTDKPTVFTPPSTVPADPTTSNTMKHFLNSSESQHSAGLLLSSASMGGDTSACVSYTLVIAMAIPMVTIIILLIAVIFVGYRYLRRKDTVGTPRNSYMDKQISQPKSAVNDYDFHRPKATMLPRSASNESCNSATMYMQNINNDMLQQYVASDSPKLRRAYLSTERLPPSSQNVAPYYYDSETLVVNSRSLKIGSEAPGFPEIDDYNLI